MLIPFTVSVTIKTDVSSDQYECLKGAMEEIGLKASTTKLHNPCFDGMREGLGNQFVFRQVVSEVRGACLGCGVDADYHVAVT